MGKLTIGEKMALAFKKKSLPKLKFIFLIERESGLVVYIQNGYRFGEQYLIRDRNQNITWRLGLPPNKAIMQSANKGVGGVVMVYVPDREIFLYLTSLKKLKTGKWQFTAIIDGEKKKIVIDKPIFLLPKLEISELEMKKLSQEAMMRRLYVEETELTKKQKEAMIGLLQKWAPVIATGVLVILVIVVIYAGMNAYSQTMGTITSNLAKLIKAIPHTVAHNATHRGVNPNW